MAITTAKQNASSIAMALAGKSHRVDIPRPRDSGSYASPAATGQPHTASGSNPKGVDLPTPPASISPSLPPQAYLQRKQALLDAAAPPSPPSGHGVESDIDLQDAVEHARAQDTISHPRRRETASEVSQSAPVKGLDATSLAALDSHNAVNAGMLARDHLPAILLEHGPLAIRYIMGFLTQTVPGFSSIPGAKARRLVVAALEGNFNQEVEFEKVGWGRWDAHKRGERRASRQSSPGRELSGLPRYSSSSRDRSQPSSSSRERSLERTYPSYPSQPISSLRIPNRPRQAGAQPKRKTKAQLGQSLSPDLVPFGMETEADRMSLDGDDDALSGGGSSTTNPDDVVLDDDMDDATDEEDWASIGAAALRQGSYSHSHGTNRMLSSYSHSHGAKHTMTLSHRTRHDSTNHATSAGVRKRPTAMRQGSLAKSAPSPNLLAVTSNLRKVKENALEGCADDNERQAVAALMSLGAL